MACDLYCFLQPQCEALSTCCSGFPIATVSKLLEHEQFILSSISLSLELQTTNLVLRLGMVLTNAVSFAKTFQSLAETFCH